MKGLIIQHINPPYPPQAPPPAQPLSAVLTPEGEKAIKMVSAVIVKKPKKIAALLKQYGVTLPAKPKGKEIALAVWGEIIDNNREFLHELARLMAYSGIKYSNIDPITIAGISQGLSSLTNLFGGIISSKADKEKALSELQQKYLDYQTEYFRQTEKTRRANLYLGLGLVTVMAGTAAFFIYRASKRNATMQASMLAGGGAPSPPAAPPAPPAPPVPSLG